MLGMANSRRLGMLGMATIFASMVIALAVGLLVLARFVDARDHDGAEVRHRIRRVLGELCHRDQEQKCEIDERKEPRGGVAAFGHVGGGSVSVAIFEEGNAPEAVTQAGGELVRGDLDVESAPVRTCGIGDIRCVDAIPSRQPI